MDNSSKISVQKRALWTAPGKAANEDLFTSTLAERNTEDFHVYRCKDFYIREELSNLEKSVILWDQLESELKNK